MNKSLSKKQRKKLKQKQKQEQQQRVDNKFKNITQNLQKNKKNKNVDVNKNKQQQLEQNQPRKVKDNRQKNKNKFINNNIQDNDQNQCEYQSDIDFNRIIQGQENQQFSFLIAEINQKHYHSMKTILEKFSRITGIISSEWADAIISNGKAGNVVLADDNDAEDNDNDDDNDDDEDQQDENQQVEDDQDNVCSGVINILPYSHKLTKKIIQKIIKSSENKKFKYYGKPCSQILKTNNSSLLICQRAINLPPFIIQNMHEVLIKDLQEIYKNKVQYQKICNKYLVNISQVQIPQEYIGKDIDLEQLIYCKFQDYLFIKNSVSWWIGQCSPNSVRKVQLYKLYYIIDINKYFQSVRMIHTLLNE